jgi:DNA-binding MarR family transcriptional regulator
MDGDRFQMIPSDVRTFLDRSIAAVEQLEILLLLQQQPERSWDAAAIADRLRLAPAAAAAHLEALSRRSLLDVRIGGQMRYRFGPASDALRAIVDRLADVHRSQRTAVNSYLAARRLRSLHEFSEAFRLTRRDDG